MGVLSWIILGLIAGFIGSKIVDRRGQGFWLDTALGIVGALVGGFLFDLFGASGVSGLNIYSMIVAILLNGPNSQKTELRPDSPTHKIVHNSCVAKPTVTST
jgi:uncharacterized membrane protein YeaQ/YmgE (transglycosylase-associated protein family)